MEKKYSYSELRVNQVVYIAFLEDLKSTMDFCENYSII